MKKFLNMKALYIILLIISFSIILYFCIEDDNLSVLINSISFLNVIWLSVACIFMLLVWIIDAVIVKILTVSVYNQKYTFKSAFKVTMIGQFFNSVTPFCIASQPMQILTMSSQGLDAGKSISVVVRKFIIYQTTLVLYLVLAIFCSFSFFSEKIPEFMTLAILGCFSQSIVVLLILFFTVKKDLTLKIISAILNILKRFNLIKDANDKMKIVEKQLNLYVDNNKQLGENMSLTIKVFFLTLLQFTLMFSISFCVYKSFNNSGFDVVNMISGQAFITATSAYMPLPGGSGAMENAFLTVFNDFFVKVDVKPAMLLWRFITYYSCIIFGLFFALDVKRISSKSKQGFNVKTA